MNKELILERLSSIESNCSSLKLNLMNHKEDEAYILLCIINKIIGDLLFDIASIPQLRYS